VGNLDIWVKTSVVVPFLGDRLEALPNSLPQTKYLFYVGLQFFVSQK
jgi:hypothetical protein